MADRQRRELERAASQGDGAARRRLVAERVRAGELPLHRPATDPEGWIRELMDQGVLAVYAVIRLVPEKGVYPGYGDGKSWWWIRTLLGDARRGWKLEIVRLSQRGLRPLSTHGAARARNHYSPSFPSPVGYARGHVDAPAWFAKNLLEVRLDPLPRDEAHERDRRHVQEQEERRGGPRTWDPRALLDEYAAFPAWHDQLSVHAPHLNEGRDLKLVLVARKGRRGVWHAVEQLNPKSVRPECATSTHNHSFQGEVAWGEPTCARCRKKVRWDSRHEAGGRSEQRKRQRWHLERVLRELEGEAGDS